MALAPGTRVFVVPRGVNVDTDQREFPDKTSEPWSKTVADAGVDLWVEEGSPEAAEAGLAEGQGIVTVPSPEPPPPDPVPSARDAIIAALDAVEAPMSAADLAATIRDALASAGGPF